MEYIGFVNREADEDSKKASKYRGKDGKPDVRHTAFFRALVGVWEWVTPDVSSAGCNG